MKVLIIGRGLIGTYVHNIIPESILSSSSLAIENLKNFKYDWVINCTFDPSQGLSDYKPTSSFDAQIIKNLNSSKYLMLSSRKVYPRDNQWNAIEDKIIDFTDIHDIYGKNKFLIEKHVQNVLKKEKYLILRLPNIFGRNSINTVSTTFFNQMLKSLKHNKIIYFDFCRESKRDFMYAEDLAIAIFSMIEKDISGIYNCGYGKYIKCGDIANLLINFIGFGKIEDEKNLKDEFFLNTLKLNSMLLNLNFKGLEKGIKETVIKADIQ